MVLHLIIFTRLIFNWYNDDVDNIDDVDDVDDDYDNDDDDAEEDDATNTISPLKSA